MKILSKSILIVFSILFYSNARGQSGIEYQFIKYPNSQDLLLKWEIDEKFPNAIASLKSNNQMPTISETGYAVFRGVNVLGHESVKVNFSNTSNESYTLEIPIIERTGGVHTTEAVYDVIHPWTDKPESMLSEFANSPNLHPIEIYSFLQ